MSHNINTLKINVLYSLKQNPQNVPLQNTQCDLLYLGRSSKLCFETSVNPDYVFSYMTRAPYTWVFRASLDIQKHIIFAVSFKLTAKKLFITQLYKSIHLTATQEMQPLKWSVIDKGCIPKMSYKVYMILQVLNSVCDFKGLLTHQHSISGN
jgi:hypothetical protein